MADMNPESNKDNEQPTPRRAAPLTRRTMRLVAKTCTARMAEMPKNSIKPAPPPTTSFTRITVRKSRAA